MILKLNEQDVMNAVCIYTADRERVDIYSIDADLRFNRDNAEFYTIVTSPIRGSVTMNHQGMVDSIAHYLNTWHNFKPDVMEISMEFTEGDGIFAEVSYTEA